MPLIVVSGGDPLLRRRAVLEAFGGRRVDIVHSAAELERSLAPQMFEAPASIWCRALITEESLLQASAQHEETVVLELESDPPSKSFLSKRKDLVVKWNSLPTPKPWDRRKFAVDFVREEAMRLTLILPEAMASLLVSLVGTDLGVLAFELDKLSMLCKQEGQAEISAKLLSKTLGGFVETGIEDLITSVGQRHARSIVGSLTLVEHTHGSGSSTVLRVCATLLYHARIWLCCKTLCGGDPGPLGERLSLHPFVLKKQHFPHAVRWTEQELLVLIAGLAGVGRAVRQGAVCPHVRLQGVLVGLAKSA